MKPPLRYRVFEFIKDKKAATDDEIFEFINKGDTYSVHELNKCLMDLEILGAISVRWVAKEKRRVEYVEVAPEPIRYGEG